MKGNGEPKPPEYTRATTFTTEVRAMSHPTRLGLLAWARRWRQQPPARQFWLLDEDSGEWREL